jgi:trehalose synthase-fused probable maltokinase
MSDLLRGWIVGQRWYAAKGTTLAGLTRIGGFRLDCPGGPGVGIEVHVVRAVTVDGVTSTYQVPLTYRARPEPELALAEVGVFWHPDLGARHVYDAPHDPVFVAALLDLLNGGRATAAVEAERGRRVSNGGRRGGLGRAGGGAVGVMQRPEPPRPAPARVLSGEQSNTSIIVGAAGPDPMIVKLFRVLHTGSNPDVVVQTRLAAAGCDRVPRPIGWVEGSWSPGPEGPLAQGHLAYACEFVADGEDAWRLACRAVEADASFVEEAHELGRATAEVHAVLARALPTVAADAALLDRLAGGLAGRVRWAVNTVPALEPIAAAALQAVDAVRSLVEPPALQQIHGDYHLGQVLRSPTRGWVLLDFEGEPLRPLVERLEPDLALRDVAGMLRSFDYAAGHATVGLKADDPRAVAAHVWSRGARAAFLAGYAAGGGRIDGEAGCTQVALLRALEIDKALYEVVYETLNRPDWVDIPLSALRRLVGG